MNVEYLWDQDCHGCLTMKHHDIVRRCRLLIESLPDVWFESKPIGEITKYLEIEDGRVAEKTVTLGNGIHDFADRRPEEYTGLVTPMIHLVDPYPETKTPIIGQYSEKTGVVYEEIVINDLLGEEMDTLQKVWENEYYEDADHEIERVPKPCLAARLIMKRIFRFYRYNVSDMPGQAREELRELEPDLAHGTFQLRGWYNAFSRIHEVRS